MSTGPIEIVQSAYRELRPRSAMPDLKVEFFPFANVNNTIRLRENTLILRISDVLEGAPTEVIYSIAHILIAKLYRKPIDTAESARYRRYVGSRGITEKAHLLRAMRGRKRIEGPLGNIYDLHAIFEDLNIRFFHGLLARPQMTWSQRSARYILGHYDPAHNAIVVSRVFDDLRVPKFVLEYLVYHEMLHLKHPVRLRGSRRCVHGPQFQADEKLFPRVDEAKQFLKRL